MAIWLIVGGGIVLFAGIYFFRRVWNWKPNLVHTDAGETEQGCIGCFAVVLLFVSLLGFGSILYGLALLVGLAK